MDDLAYMGLAVAEAQAAAEKGEVPVGCVILLGGRVVARAGNETISACDPSAHAEIVNFACSTGILEIVKKEFPDNQLDLFTLFHQCMNQLDVLLTFVQDEYKV